MKKIVFKDKGFSLTLDLQPVAGVDATAPEDIARRRASAVAGLATPDAPAPSAPQCRAASTEPATSR